MKLESYTLSALTQWKKALEDLIKANKGVARHKRPTKIINELNKSIEALENMQKWIKARTGKRWIIKEEGNHYEDFKNIIEL